MSSILASVNQTQRPSFVSDNYGFIQTAPLVQLMQSYGWHVSKINAPKVRKVAREGFQKHYLEFLPSNAEQLLARDGETPRIVLINSHDRTSAFTLALGWFRAICENGLLAGDSIVGAFKVFHSGRELERKVYELVGNALERFPQVDQARIAMRSTLLNSEQIAELTINVNKEVCQLRKLESINSPLYNIQRREDQSQDLWTVFNVLQEQSLSAVNGTRAEQTNDGTIRSNRIKARKVKSLELDHKINKAVFEQAYNMLQKVGA